MVCWSIETQGDAVPAVHGTYNSFPCLAADPVSGHVWMLYRHAHYDEADPRPGMRAHGLDGSLSISRFDTDHNRFLPGTLLVDGRDYPPGLIDGILTVAAGRWHLLIRRYPAIPAIYGATGSHWDALSAFRPFPCDPEFPMGAEWGKVLVYNEGRSLGQVIYGGPRYLEPDVIAGKTKWHTRSGLYESNDGGQTWSFVNWISPLTLEENVSANETAIVVVDEVFYALMRVAGRYPGPLWLAKSTDHGRSWTRPWPSGFYGEAPVWRQLPDGRILCGFRGYREHEPGEGGTFSVAMFDPQTETFSTPFTVESYTGNHYDGGYGDMIWVASCQRLLTVYYYAKTPTPRNPWIRYALVNVG